MHRVNFSILLCLVCLLLFPPRCSGIKACWDYVHYRLTCRDSNGKDLDDLRNLLNQMNYKPYVAGANSKKVQAWLKPGDVIVVGADHIGIVNASGGIDHFLQVFDRVLKATVFPLSSFKPGHPGILGPLPSPGGGTQGGLFRNESYQQFLSHRLGHKATVVVWRGKGVDCEVAPPDASPSQPHWNGRADGTCHRTFEGFTLDQGRRTIAPHAPEDVHDYTFVEWNEAHRVYVIQWGSQRIVGRGTRFEFDDRRCSGKPDAGEFIPGCIYKSRSNFTVRNSLFYMDATTVRISARGEELGTDFDTKKANTTCVYTKR